MSKIIDVSGKGAAISAAENDANLDSLSGINAPITATTHTIDVDDQNDTIEYSHGTGIAVTLPAISTVSGGNIHTSDFKVTLKNIGAGDVVVTCGGTNTFENGATSLTLGQYDSATIQTDSTLAKWNIISRDIDTATKTGTETLTNKTLTSPVLNTGVSGTAVKDDDTMADDSATHVCTQQSIKAYVDTKIAAAGTGSPLFRAYLAGSYTSGTGAVITMNTETYDITSDYNTGTYRFTPSESGYYLITVVVRVSANVSTGVVNDVLLRKNGTAISRSGDFHTVNTDDANYGFSDIVLMNGSTDYLDVYTGTAATFVGGSTTTFWTGHKVQA